MPTSPSALSQDIVTAAMALGFARVGFAPAELSSRDGAALDRWVTAGMHGTMAYLHRGDARHDVRSLLREARTVVVVALPYSRGDGASSNAARVARYARGRDYHGVVRAKLEQLASTVTELTGGPVVARACVDTAPLLERAVGAQAGLGFVGKSSMLIAPGVGTDFVLGELLLDIELPAGGPLRTRCGSCTACLDRCPTGAFAAPYVLDARRCISYLTIEYRGVLPMGLRRQIGTHLFGCDVCQDVCPFNASPRPRALVPEFEPDPALVLPNALDWLQLTSSGYRRLVRGNALRRANRAQLKRNAAVVLGNLGDEGAVPALIEALGKEPSALVRQHVAWALGALGGAEAAAALEHSKHRDDDEAVRQEAAWALGKS